MFAVSTAEFIRAMSNIGLSTPLAPMAAGGAAGRGPPSSATGTPGFVDCEACAAAARWKLSE